MSTIYLNRAVKEDVGQHYLEAIDLYEKAILNQNASSIAFINLSFLYWQIASEFAFRDKFKISDKLAFLGAERYKEVIEAGLKSYPANTEMIFWNKYFPHRLFYDDFSYDQPVEIVKKSNDKNLVPYFYLCLFDKEKYRAQRDALWDECNKVKTAKNVYIKSVIAN